MYFCYSGWIKKSVFLREYSTINDMEPEDPHEMSEKLEALEGFSESWSKYLALTTVSIAVLAAIASLLAGRYATEAILEKNNAVLFQTKVSDQWSYYQAKGVKKNIAEAVQTITGNISVKDQVIKYTTEQADVTMVANEYEKQRDEANIQSAKFIAKHQKFSFAVTLFQVAISLSAMAALLRRKYFWYGSIFLTLVGLWFFVFGFR